MDESAARRAGAAPGRGDSSAHGRAARRLPTARGAVTPLLATCLLLPAAVAVPAEIVVPDDRATIQAGLDAAVAGDTVLVKDTPGPYFEKLVFPNGGASGAYIALRAFPGHSPIIDGTGVAGDNMVLIDGKSYVKIAGFEIRNNLNVNDGSGVRVRGSGSHIEIRDNRIHDMRGRHAMGITVYGTETASISDLIIDGNEIYDCEPAQSETLTLNGNVERFEVTNNVVRDVNNIGIDFIGGETDIQPDPAKVARDGVCRGNTVLRARSTYGGGYAGGIYVDGGRDIVIERNVVAESDLGIEIGAENPGIVVTGVIVRDNLVYRNEKAGIAFGGYAASRGRVRDSFFLNNTCYQNDTLGVGLGELWIQFADHNAIRNNIFFSTAQNVLLYSESGNIDNALDYNLWYAEAGANAATFVWRGTAHGGFAAFQAGSGQDGNSAFGAPEFVDPAGADFHLTSSSPAVNAGDPAFVPGAGETDIDAAPRVSGGRVDIGADEVTCGDTVLDPGETCDDGNLVDCDGCDSNCTLSAVCGNRIACGGEECDDGNTADGDCCSAACELEAAGSGCDDADLCTIADQCDGAGTCAGTAAAAPVCRGPTVSGASLVVLRDKTPDTRDRLVWRWTRGEATELLDLGDPLGTATYALCMYDQSAAPQPVFGAQVPPGGTCAGRPCWKAVRTGYRYRDANRAAGGLQAIALRTGAAGKARIVVRGKGGHLPLPGLGDLTPPVTVQLKNDAGECWGATFATPIASDAEQFRARSE